MADGQVAVQGVQVALVEDLRDQAHVLVDEDLVAVADRDAGRLLAAVLQGVQAEVGELGDLFTGGPDAEDAAGVLGALLPGQQVVGEAAIGAGHAPSLRRRAGGQGQRSLAGSRSSSPPSWQSALRYCAGMKG